MSDKGVDGSVDEGYLPGAFVRHGHRVGAALIVTFALLCMWAVRDLSVGDLRRPGPALWVLMTGSLTAVLGLVEVIFGKRTNDRFDIPGSVRVLVSTLAMIAFVLVYPFVGFVPSAALVMLVLLRFIFQQRLLTSVLVSGGVSAGLYVLFGELLGVRLTAFLSPFG